jgi:hypothetical protein
MISRENNMHEKELFQRNLRSQLDAWQLAVITWKAGTADRLIMKEHLEELQGKIEEGRVKHAQLTAASNDVWEPIKGGEVGAWDSMKSGFNEAVVKFKRYRAYASVA